MAILNAFLRFRDEAAIIGRLLAGYADLEISLMHCVQVVREDLDTVLKAMFRARGETSRIDIADAFGRQQYNALNLGTQFAMAVGAVRYCLKIRNQYAHSVWWDDNTGRLAFADLENLAEGNAQINDLRDLTPVHVDVPVLQAQLAYFEYADRLLVWVNYEGRYRAGKLKDRFGAAPAQMAQPALYI